MIIDPNLIDDAPLELARAASVIQIKAAYLQGAARAGLLPAKRTNDGAYQVTYGDVAAAVWSSRKIINAASARGLLHYVGLVEAASDSTQAFKATLYLKVCSAAVNIGLPEWTVLCALSEGQLSYYTPFGNTIWLHMSEVYTWAKAYERGVK